MAAALVRAIFCFALMARIFVRMGVLEPAAEVPASASEEVEMPAMAADDGLDIAALSMAADRAAELPRIPRRDKMPRSFSRARLRRFCTALSLMPKPAPMTCRFWRCQKRN